MNAGHAGPSAERLLRNIVRPKRLVFSIMSA
jgi:hypothetical protein